MIKIGKLEINLGFNKPHCFGLGFEFHTMVSEYEDLDSLDTEYLIDARVFRIDLLLFFINFTLWSLNDLDNATLFDPWDED
jgi:hypothetical protein